MTGHWVEFDWHGRPARAWMPDPLRDRERETSFTPATIRIAEQALAALRVSDARRPTNWDTVARLLLRAEGIASSSIEGLRSPMLDIALAEVRGGQGDAGWIADNLATVADALGSPGDLSLDLLHSWHRRLMQHSDLQPHMIGAFRDAPSWIGGTSPRDAAFVPPPASAIDELMLDLVDYANGEHHDPVTQAALVHAQFETIHPYGDGNGRVGRLLIGWILRRRGAVESVPPPISVLIALDPGGYISGLHLFRESPPDPWVRWFAEKALAATTKADEMIERITDLLDAYEAAMSDLRADAAARRLIAQLPEAPVLSARIAAELLDVSERAARIALDLLVERQILEIVSSPPAGPGRPAQHYAARQLLDQIAG